MYEIRQGCPYCGEPIDLLVDTELPEQSYIEDCSVCCRPIDVQVTVVDGGVEVILKSENEV